MLVQRRLASYLPRIYLMSCATAELLTELCNSGRPCEGAPSMAAAHIISKSETVKTFGPFDPKSAIFTAVSPPAPSASKYNMLLSVR